MFVQYTLVKNKILIKTQVDIFKLNTLVFNIKNKLLIFNQFKKTHKF